MGEIICRIDYVISCDNAPVVAPVASVSHVLASAFELKIKRLLHHLHYLKYGKSGSALRALSTGLALVDCGIAGESLHGVNTEVGGRINIRINMHKSKCSIFHSAGLMIPSTRASRVHGDLGRKRKHYIVSMFPHPPPPPSPENEC